MNFYAHKPGSLAAVFLLIALVSCTPDKEVDEFRNLTSYYVAADGNDEHAGTIDTPLATIQKAIEYAEAGDSIIVRGGTYTIDRFVRFYKSGDENKWITLMAYPGETPVLDAYTFTAVRKATNPNQHHNYGVIHMEGVSYIRIAGIKIINARGTGIMMRSADTHHIEIQACTVDGSYSSGIALWYAEHVTVSGCEIAGANDPELKLPDMMERSETPHEALTIAGAKYFDIEFNTIHHCMKEGIDCKEVSAFGVIHNNTCHDNKRQGLYVDSWFGQLHDVEFHSNVVYNCEWGIAICAEGERSSMNNVRIHHNVFFNNRGSAVFFGVWGNDEERRDIYIYNNTMYNNGSPTHWAGPTGGIDVRSFNLQDIYIFNNICSKNAAYEIATFDNPEDDFDELTVQNIVISNNLSHEFKDLTDHQGLYNPVFARLGENAVEGDPLFVNIASEDFHLTNGSPAINAGMQNPPLNTNNDLGALPFD